MKITWKNDNKQKLQNNVDIFYLLALRKRSGALPLTAE